MVEIKFCSVCGSKVAESDQFCGSCSTKRTGRQKFSLPRKSLGCHKVRSDVKPSHKIVDTSSIIEVGIMDMSKGNLEPVRVSRLPVKVGKDVNQEEICQLAIKKHCDHDQFFSNLEQYVLLYPDKKLVYQVPGTTEMFTLAKYKTELGELFSKLALFICKEKDFQSGLLKGFHDEVHILIFNIFFMQK